MRRSTDHQQVLAAAVTKPMARWARSAVADAAGMMPSRCRRLPLWRRCGFAVLAVLAHATAAATTTSTACLSGTYSSNGLRPCTGTPCAVGHFGPAMQTSADAATCADCEAGRFSAAAGSAACTACPTGKWQNEATSSTCLACAVGRFSAVEASASDTCADCEAGRFSAAVGSAVCTACPAGKWQGEATASTCLACAAGRFSAVETSISDTCADCAAELFSFGGASACCAPGLVAVGGVPCTSDASALLAASDTIVLGAGTFTWLTEQTIASKNVTIVGAGASSTIIDAQGKTRLFMILSGGHVAVKNVTITGGKAVRAASDCASLLILLCALC